MNSPQHTYEEIREVVVNIILKRVAVAYEPSQWVHLLSGVAEVFARRESQPSQEVSDISPDAVVYLDEAVSAFYAGCLLASCVMLAVAAEAEFLRLADIASNHPTYGPRFSAVAQRTLIRQKITKFHECLKPLIPALPYEATEDLETNLLAIQSVLRIARNDAGHPTGAAPQREQVYIYLQLFVPFARQLMRLRQAFA